LKLIVNAYVDFEDEPWIEPGCTWEIERVVTPNGKTGYGFWYAEVVGVADEAD